MVAILLSILEPHKEEHEVAKKFLENFISNGLLKVQNKVGTNVQKQKERQDNYSTSTVDTTNVC